MQIKSNSYFSLFIKSALAISMFFVFNPIFAQETTKNLQIINADALEFDESQYPGAQRLIGNVQMKQDSVMLFCDSAYFYKDSNIVIAYSHVRIMDAEGLNITSDLLRYDGNNKKAYLQKNVYIKQGQQTLTTQRIDYDMSNKIGYYMTPGEMTYGSTTIKSKTGYYHGRGGLVILKGKVEVVSPEYKIYSDTLHYLAKTEKTSIFGPTHIYTNDSYIYAEGGWFNTKQNESLIYKKAYLKNKDGQVVKADTLYNNEGKNLAYAIGNVQIIDSIQKTTAFCGRADMNRKNNKSILTKNAMVIIAQSEDSLILLADTIIKQTIWKDSVEMNEMIAKSNALGKQANMVFKADSIAFSETDSMFKFFKKPIIWNDNMQLTGDSIYLQIANKEPKSLELKTNSYVISKHDTARFDQLKGKNVFVYFKDKKTEKVEVKGNAESIYYLKDSKQKFISVAKIIGSTITINIENSKPTKILYNQEPTATIYPIKKVSSLNLEGFIWYGIDYIKALDRISSTQKSYEIL